MDDTFRYDASNGTLHDYYCADWGFIQKNTGHLHEFKYEPECEFPMINKGFLDQSEYVPGDCSMTYAEVYGSQYTTICLVYTFMFLVLFVFSALFAREIRNRRLKRGSKKANSSEVIIFVNCVITFADVLWSLDVLKWHGYYSVLVWNIFVGISGKF